MRKQSVIQQAQRPVWKILKAQLIVLLLATSFVVLTGAASAALALLGGGLCWLVPSSLHALIFMSVIWASQVKQTIKRFILAEIIRIGFSGVITAFLLIHWPSHALWILAGLGLTALAVVFSPLLEKVGL